MQVRPAKNFTILEGYTIINMFSEASTRARISFEVAEKRMGASTIFIYEDYKVLKRGC